MWPCFSVTVPAKWVLCGEHAVLRGAEAIAFPYFEKSLTLSFEPNMNLECLKIQPLEAQEVLLNLLSVPKLLDLAPSVPVEFFRSIAGTLKVESSIPIGSGLGSSAAICVALAKWLQSGISFDDTSLFPLAVAMENQLHGKSSGMDIAVILTKKPIRYLLTESNPIGRAEISMNSSSLDFQTFPHFQLHDTRINTSTKECIQRVNSLHTKNPALAKRLDESMGDATSQAFIGLENYNLKKTQEGLQSIAKAISIAHECFLSWRLVPGEAQLQIRSLIRQGALAAKLTGAGGGGQILALWP